MRLVAPYGMNASVKLSRRGDDGARRWIQPVLLIRGVSGPVATGALSCRPPALRPNGFQVIGFWPILVPACAGRRTGMPASLPGLRDGVRLNVRGLLAYNAIGNVLLSTISQS